MEEHLEALVEAVRRSQATLSDIWEEIGFTESERTKRQAKMMEYLMVREIKWFCNCISSIWYNSRI